MTFPFFNRNHSLAQSKIRLENSKKYSHLKVFDTDDDTKLEDFIKFLDDIHTINIMPEKIDLSIQLQSFVKLKQYHIDILKYVPYLSLKITSACPSDAIQATFGKILKGFSNLYSIDVIDFEFEYFYSSQLDKSLTSLYLKRNRFSSSADFTKLEALRSLAIHDSDIDFKTLKLPKSLTSLDLSSNKISRRDIIEFVFPVSLETLILDNNPIGTVCFKMFQCTKLVKLSMIHCEIRSLKKNRFPSGLRELNLKDNLIYEISDKELNSKTRLKILNLDGNRLFELDTKTLPLLLEELSICGAKNAMVFRVSKSLSLRKLKLQTTNYGFVDFKKPLYYLEEWTCKRMTINSFNSSIKLSVHLSELNLEDCKIKSIDNLAYLFNLKNVRLHKCISKISRFPSLASSKLEKLDLSDNGINIDHIKVPQTLEEIILNGNTFKEIKIVSRQRLQKLRPIIKDYGVKVTGCL